MNIFHYDNQVYALDTIKYNFSKIFHRAFKKEQDLFLKTYKLNKIDFIYKKNNTRILKSIAQKHLMGSTRFEEYHIANMYYRLPLNQLISKQSASLILNFHINYFYKIKQKDNYADIPSLIRYFVHLVEIIECIHWHNIQIDFSNNRNYLSSILENIKSKKISIKKSINIIEKIKEFEWSHFSKKINLQDFQYQLNEFINDNSDYTLIINGLAYKIKSNFIVKNLNLFSELNSLDMFYNQTYIKKVQITDANIVDTTQQNLKYFNDTQYITQTKKYLGTLAKENRIEEKSALKETIQVKISFRKNSKSAQEKRILAISASIAKNKLQLPSLYNIPSIGVLSTFCNFLLLEAKTDIATFYSGIFIISIITGMNPENTIKSFFFDNKKKKQINNEITVKISSDYFAEYKRFNEEIGLKTTNEIQYKIPFILRHYIKNLQEINIKFNEDVFKKELLVLAKKSNKTIHINFNKIFISSLIHNKILYKDINTELLLSSQNIDQNLTPILAYTAIQKDMNKYSNWLNEYIEILDLKNELQKYLFGKPLENKEITINSSIKTELIGSRKLVKKDIFIKFLLNIESLLKEEKCSQHERFNLYSIYVRYTLSLLLGSRDFKISLDFNRISWKKGILLIKEKGRYANSGYRIIPLSTLAKSIIKNYLSVLNDFNINKKHTVLFENNIIIPSTLTNIKKVFQNLKFYKNHLELYKMIDYIPLNLGRHIITTMVTAEGIKRDDMNAFMGHSINAGELLGLNSLHNTKEYIIKFKEITTEISEIYKLKDIYKDVRF